MNGISTGDDVLFTESQTFQQAWIRVLVIGLSVFLIVYSIYLVAEQLIMGHPVGDKPLSDVGLIVTVVLMLALGIGLPLFLFRMTLKVVVKRDMLDISLAPLTHRMIPVESIVKFETRTVKLWREYGGFGLRFSLRGNGAAYIMNGTEGVQLELSDGNKLFIGSQRPAELEKAIATAKSS